MDITQKMVDRIRRRLKALGWTHQQLAEASGIERSSITRLLGGKRKRIWITTVEKLAKGLGCKPGDLLD